MLSHFSSSIIYRLLHLREDLLHLLPIKYLLFLSLLLASSKVVLERTIFFGSLISDDSLFVSGTAGFLRLSAVANNNTTVRVWRVLLRQWESGNISPFGKKLDYIGGGYQGQVVRCNCHSNIIAITVLFCFTISHHLQMPNLYLYHHYTFCC